MPDNRPIGVFDSGVGGLTVLYALRDMLPTESTLYFGDLARCPYGVRPQTEVREFALQIADYLASLDIKALVVACNTATAAAFDDLRARYSFPVVGVVEPGAREAVRCSRHGRIGVVATDGTVRSRAYRDALLRCRPDAVVVQREASWLVPMIERGRLARSQVVERLACLMEDFRACDIDSLILGCTHFPLVEDLFREMAGDICVVDSAQTTASTVAGLLREIGMEASGPGWSRFLVTGPCEAFAERAQAMFRTSPAIETVDLLPDSVF